MASVKYIKKTLYCVPLISVSYDGIDCIRDYIIDCLRCSRPISDFIVRIPVTASSPAQYRRYKDQVLRTLKTVNCKEYVCITID